MNHSSDGILLNSPVKIVLLKTTVPMFFGIVSMIIFNLVDAIYIGQLGSAELAALSFTFPVIFVITSLSMGLGIGASIVISQAIGRGHTFLVKKLTTHSLTLSVLIVALVVLIGIFTITPLFSLLGARGDILILIKKYMFIWYFGSIFVVIPMVGNNAIRATGDMKTPAVIMGIAALINLVLDPLLIYGIGPFPRLEIEGAALATVIARASTFILSIYILHARKKMLTFSLGKIKEILQLWKEIIHIGLPNAATRMILPVGIGILTMILAKFGPAAVAAFGVANRIEFFALTILRALSSVLGPFIGQNFGANKFDRIKKAITLSNRFSLYWNFGLCCILAFLSSPISSLFTDNPEIREIITVYLTIVPLSYGVLGIMLISVSALNAHKKPFSASFLALFQMFFVCIPLALLGSAMLDYTGIFLAISCSYIISGFFAHQLTKKILKRK